MGFSRQEYWSGLPFPFPDDLPDPGIKPGSPALQADALPSEPPGKPIHNMVYKYFRLIVENYCLGKKKKSFQNMLTDNASGYSRAVMEMYKNYGIFMPANTASILQPIDQGVISIFKFFNH